MLQLDRTSVTTKINQVLFILTTQELTVKRKDLQAPTLARPSQLYQGSGPPSCTSPQQPTIYVKHYHKLLFVIASKTLVVLSPHETFECEFTFSWV